MSQLEGKDRIFRALLLEMGRTRSVEQLLRVVVDGLRARPNVALARIWLRGPGDLCEQCHFAAACPDRSECLHLVASAGRSIAEPDADWSRTDGEFRRIPIGLRKIGHAAATGQSIEIADVSVESQWIAHPAWAEREGIRGFSGQPLLSDGGVAGVLGVFTRRFMEKSTFEWLRLIADHAGIALANARAFEEIERLRARLALENEYLREEVGASFGEFVGRSPALRQLLERIDLVAPTDATVLVTGESGTGKELVAREVHKRSGRRDGPLIKVNCASIPRELFESEFFGHVRGAFTGAARDRDGRFAAAHGGTLFLDEVGEIPLDLQGKLLRVLQERQYERVGEERTREVDVRVVAATNRDLAAEVERGRFREDLFYRFNVFPVETAPLRERPEDVGPLAQAFLRSAAAGLGRPAPRLTQAEVRRLERYSWPGNVRELQNVIERSLITSTGRTLQVDLPEPHGRSGAVTSTTMEDAGAVDSASTATSPSVTRGRVLSEPEMRRFERDNLLAALEAAAGKVSGPGGAAELLGVPATTLEYRLKKFGFRRRRTKWTAPPA